MSGLRDVPHLDRSEGHSQLRGVPLVAFPREIDDPRPASFSAQPFPQVVTAEMLANRLPVC